MSLLKYSLALNLGIVFELQAWYSDLIHFTFCSLFRSNRKQLFVPWQIQVGSTKHTMCSLLKIEL